MNRWIAAIALAAALPAVATEDLPICAKEPGTLGMRDRIEGLRKVMSRSVVSVDAEERQRLLELHAKMTHEAMQQLRRREASVACRQELMHALVEQAFRFQVAMVEVR